jgi:hypothetical protein
MKTKTMLAANFFITLIVLNNSLGSCNSSDNYDKMNDTIVVNFCQSFVKAICTKDTATFYKLVDKEVLTASMNEWIQDGKTMTQEDLFFPFFFVYSPLKIRNQDLMSARSKDNFFSSFKILSQEKIDTSTIKVNLEWLQNLPEANQQKIELYLRKGDEWKVTKARWETL